MGKTIQVFGFDTVVPVEAVTAFFESFTGRGTVYAAEVKKSRRGRRPYARVQFVDDASAETVFSLTNQGLRYGHCTLSSCRTSLDVSPVVVPLMDSLALNFGCHVSRDKFLTLWRHAHVSVTFRGDVMCFVFCFNSSNYKLELPYHCIWRIFLHHHRSQPTKFLLIQLYGAPRIYKTHGIGICTSPEKILEWVRTVDFTPSCIGQSSAMCLELPHDIALPDFNEYFRYYKVAKNQLIVERGVPYCHNSVLVPIVGPRQGVELPYEILFKISSLVQSGCLPGPVLDTNFFQLVDPQRIEMAYVEDALNKMSYFNECCYEPTKWLKEQYDKYLKSRKVPKSHPIRLDNGLVYVRRVLVTPSKVYFFDPEVNMSNRVLRNYMEDTENFVRVSFVDEDWEKIYSTDLSQRTTNGNESRRTEIYERILSTLKNGIVIGKKRFEFLAFSSSQLRENSVWMFASRPGLTAADIRMSMGDFRRIRNVAKYAARLGQSFGSSKETLSVGRRDREIIPDISATGEAKYVFSDGIGKISADFARKVAVKCGLKAFTPSAFQIRYAGYKGVVSVDPSSQKKLSLRRSMLKYESENTKLDVLAWSKYQPCFLNRQIITLLSTLGITDDVFLKKLRDAVAQLDSVLSDSSTAQKALEQMSPGESTNILKEMLKSGYKPDGEPFLSMMLRAFRASKLQDLRTKARLFIQHGRTMMGCLDETGVLEYGQVFVQYSPGPGRRQFHKDSLSTSNRRNVILERTVVVAKNPCLHPGDVRVLTAVNVPELHHMVDCIVFPQRGMRPHPNECSGSDLDGDVYFVCWDSDLIPPKQIPPMDYTPAPSTVLDHDVTIEEVMEYFTNYMLNDSLGIIANAHTVFADNEQDKAMSDKCIQLAKLFSVAVDFPKTGVPAEIPSHLCVKEYPDFMEKPKKDAYRSERVIGQLYREVKKLSQGDAVESFTKEVARKSYDPDMEVDGFEDYIDEALDYKSQYDSELRHMMKFYRIKTEAEILSGGMMKMSRSFDQRKDAEAISYGLSSLKKKVRAWFGKQGSNAEAYAKASAWYHVTYHPTYWDFYDEGKNQAHLISFPWCIYDKLIEIKKRNSSRKPLHVSPLGLQFRYV